MLPISPMPGPTLLCSSMSAGLSSLTSGFRVLFSLTVFTDSHIFLYRDPKVALGPQCASLDLCLRSSAFLCSIRLFLSKSQRVGWFQITLTCAAHICSNQTPHPVKSVRVGMPGQPQLTPQVCWPQDHQRWMALFQPLTPEVPPTKHPESSGPSCFFFTLAPILALPGEKSAWVLFRTWYSNEIHCQVIFPNPFLKTQNLTKECSRGRKCFRMFLQNGGQRFPLETILLCRICSRGLDLVS